MYATKLVCGLIEGKLKENHITNYTLNEVHHGDEVQIGCMKVGFIHTNHSIPDASALYFRTPVGTIVHTGDFKVDMTPVDGKQMDMHKFAELGRRGVLLLMSDSTNAERPGYTESETTVGHAFRKASAQLRAVLSWRHSLEYFPYPTGYQYGHPIQTQGNRSRPQHGQQRSGCH